ncbi:MAG: D-alanyl-D-alanine carboxypeptidase family protein [Mahellales bacterium]|jgi:D-alanyl-D-alanine carboxypeptidase (penicillin-binding protein 5/6)
MSKKVIRWIALLMASVLIFVGNIATVKADDFNFQAKAAILMENSTGEIIYEKNAHEKLPIASITKIMTLLLIMEALEQGKISLEDRVRVSEYASSMGGSQIYLSVGEEFTVDDLVKSIAVASANDASVAMAELIYGTEEMFVKNMNKRAKELGMKNTYFKDCTGLTDEGHYSTAYDIAIMSRELLKYEKIHKWLSIWIDHIRDGEFELVNTNRLVKFYEGCDGIKTGTTSAAKSCVAATAKKNSMRLIAVILGAPNSNTRFKEATALLDYGFTNYSTINILEKNDLLKRIKVINSTMDCIDIKVEDNISLLINKGEDDSITKDIILPKTLEAPVDKGAKIGDIIIKKGDKEIKTIEIKCPQQIERARFKDFFRKILRRWSSHKY